MKRYLPWGMAAAALLLVGSCVSQYERVTVEEESGFEGRAAYDPLFALEVLLEELGLPVERASSWRDLPPPDHTIFLPSHYFRAPVPVARLHDWVRRGGHLVVAGGTSKDDRILVEGEDGGPKKGADEKSDTEPHDPLLEPLGLAILPPGDSAEAEDEEGSEAVELETDRGSWSVRVGRRVGVSLDARSLLRAPAAAGPEDLTFSLIRIGVGEGWVTAVSDTEFLTNASIGDLDHAAFAWDVLAPPGRIPKGLTVFYRAGYSPWFKLLGKYAWPALLSGAVALALFLWSRGSRFGPIASGVAPERRSLLEHVSASGDFLWRHRLGEVLLQSSRAALLRGAARQDPVFARLPEKERIRHLAAKAGLSGGQLAAALEDRTVEDPAEFTRIMTTLESVRRTSRGAKPQSPLRR